MSNEQNNPGETSWRTTPRFWLLVAICFIVVGGIGLLSWLISNYL